MPYGDDNRAADLDLASRDPALPGLRILFVPSAFAAALGRVLPGTIEAVRPAYVRYKPGMNCLVSYRVETDNGTHEVYAKAYRNADREKLQKAVCRGSFSLDQHVVASIFPVDAKLKSLGRLSDERNRTRLLRRLLPECPELWSGDVRELRYKPERRYVARLEVDGRPVAALKFFTSLGYGAASAGARAFRSGASVRVPDRLGRSRKHQVLAYEWLHGALLSDRLTDGGCSADDFRRVGVALAELHGQAAETLPRIGQDLECARLTEVAAAIGLLHPGLAARVDVLAGRLGRSLGGLEPVMSPIHGDFYAKQVLLRADGVGVLDFDESALGDPASDLGNFIAHLERDELRGRIGTAEAQRASDALVEGYARAADVPSMGRDRLYTARCLFALAPHPFRFREANWPAATAKLVERCRELLDAERDPRPVPRRGCGSRRAARRARRIPVEDRFGIRSDPALPFIAGALEADLVEERLRQFCDRLGGAGSVLALRQIRVLRHKPGRRCLIEYELDVARPGHPSGQLALIGKVRARGLDAKTYSLCGRLWRTGFGDASADRIS
ncbi:MAG: phosphotransferase family protein, partial [Gemmatimonadota bacterium]